MMMWFEQLTGFPETSPTAVRKQLRLTGTTITSLVNQQSWICGSLELVSLSELRERTSGYVKNSPLRVTEVVGDVQDLHANSENAGAVFQVASQFNLLEMVSPEVTPGQGVGIYGNDFTQGPAMTEAECVAALQAGWSAVDTQADVLVTGEMGIGNTTSGAAICHALFGGSAQDWTGRGTGVDDAGLRIKTDVVSEGVALHTTDSPDGLDVLARLGGRELAAMAGAIAAARARRIPVVLDGFICCAAAACLHAVNTAVLDHTVAGHKSEEGGHMALLNRLGKQPLLNLGLRLGEGSGGALAINIVKSAVACHSGMATFAEAGVSDA